MKIQLHRNLMIAPGAACLAAASPAFSQTLVRDIEQPGLQGTIEQPPILNSEDLYLLFPVPPAGKRLVVE